MSHAEPLPQPGRKEGQDLPCLLSGQEVDRVIGLLCAGASAEQGVSIGCCLFDPGGAPRLLQIKPPHFNRNQFCKMALGLTGASSICNAWYKRIARVLSQNGPLQHAHVCDCPFGLGVLVATSSHLDQVKAVLFAGNWRDAGAEGRMLDQIFRRHMPHDEKKSLGALVLSPARLPSEEIDHLKYNAQAIANELSKTIAIIYARDRIARESRLIRSIQQTPRPLSKSTLKEVCAGLRETLRVICEELGVKYAILFANTGLTNTLDATSWYGIDTDLVDGLHFSVNRLQVLREAAAFPDKTAEARSQWLSACLSFGTSRRLPKELVAAEDIVPIELTPSYSALLLLGPQDEPSHSKGSPMPYGDTHDLAMVARRYLTDGLLTLAEKQEVGDILSRTSHVIRGPLFAMIGALIVLKEAIDAGSFERDSIAEVYQDVQQQLDEIATQVERIDETRRTALSEKRVPVFKKHSLYQILDRLCRAMRQKADDRDITLGSLQQVRALPNVEVDLNTMRVVFVNLLDNAIKYAHRNSQIGFAATTTVFKGKPAIRIGISNFGVGIHPDELEEVFLAGFQGSVADETRHIEGTGIGLAVCRDIVENAHKGRIWATCAERSDKPGSYQHCDVEFLVELLITQ